MHLGQVVVGGFRSYGSAVVIGLARDFTILAGRNNVGKTATLRAIQLAAEPADGVREDLHLEYHWTDVPSTIIGSTFDKRQEWSRVLLEQLESVDRQRVVVTFCHSGRDLQSLTALPMVPEQPTLNSSANLGQLKVRKVELPDTGIVQEWGRTQQSGNVTYAWTGGPLSTPEAKGKGWMHALLGDLATQGGQLCTDTYYIAPRRIVSESTQFSVETKLASDGQNLTNVIATLHTEKPEVFAAVERFMQGAFPEIERLRIHHWNTQPGLGPNAELQLEFAGGAQPIPLRFCGTGIEQLLIISTGVLTSLPGRLFLLDEPHAFLHPHAERELLKLLGLHQEHQFIAATHSNLLLSSIPLSSVRLVSLVDGSTAVTSVRSADAIFAEVGVTAADLWGSDYVLWVEGPSERAILETIVGSAAERGLAIRPMPGASRFGAASTRIAQATFEFVRTVSEAVSLLPVKMLFLFDNDEKTEEVKSEVNRASGGRASFLAVREIENLLLSPSCIRLAITERCEILGLEHPTLAAVESAVKRELNDLADEHLYRQREHPSTPDPALVVGSEVLRRLYFEFAQSEYDKVSDGRRLTEFVLEHEPSRLKTLSEIVQHLISN